MRRLGLKLTNTYLQQQDIGYIPSSILISSTLGGKSSILISTKIRHSGHLNSFRLA